MAEDPTPLEFEFTAEGEELEPLVPAEAGCESEAHALEFDESGALVGAEGAAIEDPGLARPLPRPGPVVPPRPPLFRPCSLGALNGSWLLQLTPARPPHPVGLFETRGPMRVEASATRLRISGDVYVRRLILPPTPARGAPDASTPIAPGAVIARNWYPAYPQSEYRWYFRSLGVTYANGLLTFGFERHLWDVAQQQFTAQDTGSVRLTCRQVPVRPPWAPQPTIQMTGTATIGGTSYTVTATKTSPFYRGCLVEVDVMTNRQWPATATSCDGQQAHTFQGVYRTAGMDFRAVVNEVNVPDDTLLTIAELHGLLTTHRSLSPGGENWRLWLLIGSRMDGTLGIMFDTGNPPHREGAVGFHDPTLANSPAIHAPARGRPLGEVPLAFLRTMVHEAGHAFNLFHPKHDVHAPPVGTTIMNQTGDVIGFATAANPYPCTATMAFDEHNRTSLIHSPDPQVKPGWKEFGWGHSTTFAGIAEPVDADGLRAGAPGVPGLRLELRLPEQVHRGEFVSATVTVINTGEEPQRVTAALNLSEGDLWLSMVSPTGERTEVRDVVLACGDRRVVELGPGESISGELELFHTSSGLTFDQSGTYTLQAEADVGEVPGDILLSEPARVVVRPAVSDQERELERLTVDPGVGLALGLGDFGAERGAQERLTAVMDGFPDTDTAAACAMVIANSAARDVRDVRGGDVDRPADDELAGRAFDVAVGGRDAATVARLAAAVVSPVEPTPPLLERVRERLSAEGEYGEEDASQASKILDDHSA